MEPIDKNDPFRADMTLTRKKAALLAIKLKNIEPRLSQEIEQKLLTTDVKHITFTCINIDEFVNTQYTILDLYCTKWETYDITERQSGMTERQAKGRETNNGNN